MTSDMLVVSVDRILSYIGKHADARGQLLTWLAAAERADWRTPHEVRGQYARASIVGDGIVVFNIKGGDYRLAVRIDYEHGVVRILKLGTHSEYEKWKF